MAEQRAWAYRSKRPHPSSIQDQLLAGLGVRSQAGLHPGPVLVRLTDLTADTGLRGLEAITALRELARKGFITVAPVPQATDVGRDIVYAIWLEGKPQA
jgi:hypothetical protein